MKSQVLRTSLIAVAVATLTAAAATAAPIIVNINAQTNTLTLDVPSGDVPNPVPVFLEAGVWVVTPIGMSQGGLYNAWSNFGISSDTGPGSVGGGCDVNGTDCSFGWLNNYAYESAQLGGPLVYGTPYGGAGNAPYETASLALSNAVASTFTLFGVGDLVAFGFIDHPEFDNFGGMSLELVKVNEVPEPASVMLLLSGLTGLAYARRRQLRTRIS